jgi:hypothetical protein
VFDVSFDTDECQWESPYKIALIERALAAVTIFAVIAKSILFHFLNGTAPLSSSTADNAIKTRIVPSTARPPVHSRLIGVPFCPNLCAHHLCPFVKRCPYSASILLANQAGNFRR